MLFRDALVRASRVRLTCIEILEKQLDQQAEAVLATPLTDLRKALASLGKAAGPPWGKDQKDASLAAMLALAR